MNSEPKAFGKVLREKRTAAKISLRQFAEQLGVSATYLSRVEQCSSPPPTAERIEHMASLLGTNPDPLLALAGRIPEDVAAIIRQHPTALPKLIRAFSTWQSEDIEKLALDLGTDPVDECDSAPTKSHREKKSPKSWRQV